MVLVQEGPFLMGTDSDEAWEADGEKKVQKVEMILYV